MNAYELVTSTGFGTSLVVALGLVAILTAARGGRP